MAVAEGTRAVNPQTGQTAIFTNGRWVVQGTQAMPLPEADSKSMESLQQQAQDAQYLDQKAQQFIRTMDPQRPGQGSFATGPGYGGGVPIPFSHGAEIPNPAPTIVGAVDPRMAALQSITNQAWVHMRPQGSGAIRGYEASAFKEAFPGVEHWGPENQQIAQRIHQDAIVATQRLAFIDNFIRSGQGDYAAANAAWQRQFGDNVTGISQAAQGAPAQAPAGPPPGQSAGPPPIQPPMQMVPDAQSPIGAVPAPGAPLPPQLTQQQQAILNWVPGKGLVPGQ